jgi:hypothetical protein
VVPLDAVEDVVLLAIGAVELVGERDDVGAVCINSSEIPLLPSTDPVWMLDIGLHGVGVMLGGAGV